MKLDRLIWGIVLLFIGGVLLLENFGIIDFYWRNVWSFWPIFLIIAGVNILFNRNNSQTGSMIAIGILVVSLAFLFVKGQQEPERGWWGHKFKDDIDINIDDDDNNDNQDSDSSARANLFEAVDATDTLKKTILNISGGGISFNLDDEGTSKLFNADVKKGKSSFSLSKQVTDSASILNFKMSSKKQKWNFGDDGNHVNFQLNKAATWDVVMKLGAGEANLDFSPFKVRAFRFDGGAASLDIKIGNQLPITDVVVKSGIADVKIKIPEASGCRIKTKTGLSAKDFDGFNKLSDGVYETANYQSSTKKIFINLDGGLSNFEVKRY